MGFTKLEAAKRIGVSQPAYLRYESGERTPSIQVIKEMANVFHTSADYLMGNAISDSPDYITVSKEFNPELFELVNYYQDMDSAFVQKMLAYMKTLQ